MFNKMEDIENKVSKLELEEPTPSKKEDLESCGDKCEKEEEVYHNASSNASDEDEFYEADEPFLAIDEDRLKIEEEEMTNEEKEGRKEKSEKLKLEGNTLFKDENFSQAVVMYSRGLQTCPLSFPFERAVLYSNRSAALLKLDKKEETVQDCSKALELRPDYQKPLLRRALAYRKLEKLDESLQDYKKILEFDPGCKEAIEACQALPHEIEERNERLKTEMLGKLKDLGNMVLRPFGLSTNNFKLNQDPKTGGYNISFQNEGQ